MELGNSNGALLMLRHWYMSHACQCCWWFWSSLNPIIVPNFYQLLFYRESEVTKRIIINESMKIPFFQSIYNYVISPLINIFKMRTLNGIRVVQTLGPPVKWPKKGKYQRANTTKPNKLDHFLPRNVFTLGLWSP